jgi:hypothetical protein
MAPITAYGHAALFPDLGHMAAILAYRYAALTACFSRFLPIEFVCGSLLVGCLATLAGNLPLLSPVHRGESPAIRIICHVTPPGTTTHALKSSRLKYLALALP